MNIPGLTDLSSYNKPTFISFGSDKKAIVLATNDINDSTLFLNGISQNIIILYKK